MKFQRALCWIVLDEAAQIDDEYRNDNLDGGEGVVGGA